MNVYPCNTTVTIKMNNIKGLVTSILIRPNECVSYDVTCWVNNEYLIIHLYEFEFEVKEPLKSKIGFN